MAFGTALSDATPCISVVKKVNDGLGYMEVDSRLRYHAIPQHAELAPFLSALTYAEKTPELSRRVSELVENIKSPASLTLFITPQCPHCPLLVRQMIPILFSTSFLTLTIVDGLMFPEMAKTYDVKSVPNLFLDDGLQWNGMVSMEELLNAIIQRDPSQLSSLTLKNLLKEGKAGFLGGMMVQHGKIFPAFYELLKHKKWPVRLGAMVAFEEIVHQDKAVARQIVAPFMAQFDEMDDTVKGDVLYLFGLLQDVEIVPFFKKIVQGAYDGEVQEAASEALESMA